ncbi:DUF2767 domain-containing protein [Phytobacter diazotrophicus]|uniref:DUF2767 domain-containing protein n=1 Tax=Phytobacter diazotrophicus TaxID=395631 RepID=UPI00290C5471|nr:DUF2767 domain-containing protein [Enterobacteriaceae bacterium]
MKVVFLFFVVLRRMLELRKKSATGGVLMSENEDEDDAEDAFYDETCRIVGQCCLMLAINDAETDRAQLVCQLKRLHWKIMQLTSESHSGILMAIEQLETAEMYEERTGRRRE